MILFAAFFLRSVIGVKLLIIRKDNWRFEGKVEGVLGTSPRPVFYEELALLGLE